MKQEFKKIKSNNETRYVLETMTAGATGASNIASVPGAVGKVQKRDNILAQEGDKITVPVKQKPRQGPLRPQTGGGAHRDKKKEQKQGKEKHRKPYMEQNASEDAPGLVKAAGGLALGGIAAAGAPGIVAILGPVLGIPLAAYGAYNAAKLGMAGIEKLWDKASQILGGDDKVAKYVDSKLGKLPPEQAKATSHIAKKLSEMRLEQRTAEDHEIQMASSELQAIAKNAVNLLDLVRKYSEAEGLEAWQQSKITKAADYLNSVLQSISGEQSTSESRWGRSSWDTSMPDWQRREQDAMDADKRAFKYAELQHELGHEDEPYRPQRRFSSPASKGMYFYSVKPGQENDARMAGLKQSKSGKWYSTMQNPAAEKTFGPGKFWQPKNEGVAEDKERCPQCGMTGCTCPPGKCNCKPIAGWVPNKGFKKDLEEDDNPQHSHQYKTTMKHAKNPTVQQRMAAHDIRPGIKGYRDRIDLLKDLERTGKLKDNDVEEEKQRLDPKCWKGYRKAGTKMKGGVRVNNCVPVGEDSYIKELMTQLQEKAPPGDKYERMVKHIKKGYAKDGKLTDVEKSKAYGAAWKAKNKAKK